MRNPFVLLLFMAAIATGIIGIYTNDEAVKQTGWLMAICAAVMRGWER